MAIWSTLRELFRDYRFFFAFIALLFLVVLAVMSFFSPYDPTLWYYAPRDLKPSNQYILGTDSRGQDIFWQATFAIRNSLVISVVAGVISRIIALVVGLVAGYRGGRVDRFLMFVSDGFLVIPLFLIIVMLAMLIRDKMNNFTTGLLLAVFGWAWDARVIRSQVLSLREREFTKTAILSGTRTMELVFKEYMPYITPLAFSTLINNMSWAIGMEMTLSIVGLTNMDIPTLGTNLKWALNYQAILMKKWNWLMTPVVLSVVLFIALYWLSVSISEYLDPRTRVQRVGAR